MRSTCGTRSDGERRVGIEIEFGGLDIDATTRTLLQALGGRAHDDGDYRRVVEDTSLGKFIVELDYERLQSMNARRRDDPEPGMLAELSEELLAAAAAPVVPIEVVSPPIAISRLSELDRLTDALRAAGATGTHGSLLHAFGLHLNPELGHIDAAIVLAHLKAYMCLYEWLVVHERVDWKRRVTPHINPFPKPYLRLVLAPGYAPGMRTLIDDYLRLNPERNRSLDLLPLFCHVDEPRVRQAVDDPRIKPRPTFHYRLPNCEIDIPGWSVMAAWRRWLLVEALAADPPRLEQVRAAFAARLDDPIDFLAEDSAHEVARWIDAD